MLSKLHLKNYRGFKDHTITFKEVSIVVGQNNAGKSTIIEALRLVSIVSNRARSLIYRDIPEWLDAPVGNRCVSPSLRGIDFDFRNLSHQYEDPPSVIVASFDSGEEISIYLNSEEEELCAILYRAGRRVVTSRSDALKLENQQIQIMPPVGTIAKQEKRLNDEYVQANLNTNLSALHFRNQLRLYPELLPQFQELTENSWSHLQVRDLDVDASQEGAISLLIRDRRFVAEVGWVGQGLQSWLQTTWFLSRVNEIDTVVFDEPDVYLHADLQRKLIRFLTNKYRQTIVATHSLEIISDVSPENIIVVDKQSKVSNAAATLPAVQLVMDGLGGAYNLQLMRLWNAKRCLLVEGKDMDFLDVFHSKLHPDSELPLRSVPNIPLGGAGNWQHAIGIAIGLKNAGDERIATYCLLDRDYRTAEEVDEIENRALAKGLDLTFWRRKEIENYLLVPDAIRRFIAGRDKNPSRGGPKINTVVNRLESICELMKDNVIDLVAERTLIFDKRLGLPNANRVARKLIDEQWSTLEGRLAVVPGKAVFSELSKWSKRSYGVSFAAMSIAREVRAEELDSEISNVIGAIERGAKISRR